MKKSAKAILLTVIILITFLGVLLVPYQRQVCEDGDTRVYRALAATYVKWHIATVDVENSGERGYYEGFSWYLYPDSRKSIDELKTIELKKDSP